MQPSATSVTEFTIWKMFEYKGAFPKKEKCGDLVFCWKIFFSY